MSPTNVRQHRRLALALGWLLSTGLPIWLVLSSARLVMTEAYLHFEYGRPDFPPDPYGFTQDERLAYAPLALRYLQNGEGLTYLGDLAFPDGSAMYNSRELRHMADVKAVAQTAFTIHAALSLILAGVVAFLLGRAETRAILRQNMLRAGYGTIGTILALVALVWFNWDVFFDGFHSLLFESGTWRFEYSDTLIRLFPERFWLDAAITIGILTTGGALALIGIAWFWRRRARKTTEALD